MNRQQTLLAKGLRFHASHFQHQRFCSELPPQNENTFSHLCEKAKFQEILFSKKFIKNVYKKFTHFGEKENLLDNSEFP
jgi:hypothetical protein